MLMAKEDSAKSFMKRLSISFDSDPDEAELPGKQVE